MTRVFFDTSAAFALLVPTDANHDRANKVFDALAERPSALVSSSYVIVETYALISRRLGLEAVAAFREHFAPLLEIVWVDAPLHDGGLDLLLDRRRRQLSLVDAVSFLIIRRYAISQIFAYDDDFEREGFELLA